jgi:hypothetical protein
MNVRISCLPTLGRIVCGLISCFLLAGGRPVHAATVWNGPLFTFNQPASNPAQATNQDRITADVWLTRAASKGLFNAFYETSATTFSPSNTEWAFGSLTNYASLGYTNWLALLNGASPTTLVGQPLVVHLISDDIYLSINFTVWVAGGSGGFAYQRSTPTPPTIWNGPAISVSDATQPDMITDNVWLARGGSQGLYNAVTETGFTHFFSPADTEWADGTTAAPNLTSLPYTDWNTWAKNIHGGPPGTVGVNAVLHLISDDIYIDITFTSWSLGGPYSYQRSTPAVVLPPPTAVNLSGASINNGQFSFNYTADAGLAYVVQSSSNLVDWVSLSTNIASGSMVPFTNAVNPTGIRFYRIGRLPNP